MKNTILKNYVKKILKSEAVVSIAIVFVLALGIIGSSYALYMDIDTDTDYQLIEVGDLAVGFNNGSSIIELNNMTPTSDDLAITLSDNLYSFYIYNTGTYTANYKLKLASVDGNEVNMNYINYQICRDNTDNCKDINTLNETGETEIYTDELTPNSSAEDKNIETNPNTNPSAYYFVRLWINDKYTESSEPKTIKLKVIIEATNASGYLDNNNTLTGAILNNSNITINNNMPNFNGIADYKIAGDKESGEPGLYKAEDDYGISYYFRGAQSNNYVKFAGFTWRVVRINGDGSIRLILDGTLDLVKREGLDTVAGELTVFNTLNTDNAHVGYMYGLAGTTTDGERCLTYDTEAATTIDSTSTNTTKTTCEKAGGKWTTSAYEATHANVTNSTIKSVVDTFYETYIENETSGYSYGEYLSDTIFCGDKTLASGNTAGTGQTSTYYASKDRTTSLPTLKCANGALNNYSRYTVDSYITANGVETNGDLTYPIALLSMDELMMAGAFSMVKNQNYYLYDSYDLDTLNHYWWTMSPYVYWNSSNTGAGLYYSYVPETSIAALYVNLMGIGIRPVINLKADILVDSGDGTKEITYDDAGNILTKGPYTVKLY